MKRCLRWFCLFLLFRVLPGQLLTVAEESDFSRTSLYGDVMRFLANAQKSSEFMKVLPFAVSAEGRAIPLVVLSKSKVAHFSDLRRWNLPAVLIMANIHAGEIEGKEASLMLLRDICSGKRADLLENQVVLLLPIFNADGNDKLGRNRRDNGPELAGVRPNGQNLDLNRDYIKLESPEVKALLDLLNKWDPLLVVDLHTSNGSLHREPVTYSTLMNPNCDRELSNYMWQKLFPAVAKTLHDKYGYDSIPYGNFSDQEFPEKGWEPDAVEARYGSNYVGLRNRFTILDENYAYADFKTRVMGCYGLIQAILEFSGKNIRAMAELARRADANTLAAFPAQGFVLESRLEKLFTMTIKSYEFEKVLIKPEERAQYPPWIGDFIMKKTDRLRDYTVPYLGDPRPVRTIKLPAGYVLLASAADAVAKIRAHGLRAEKMQEGWRALAENFVISKIELASAIYQGHVALKISGKYESKETDFPAGAFYIGLDQPLARLVPVLLEPECDDSLAAWGFFNRLIVRQWTEEPDLYPVFRVFNRPAVAACVE